MGSCLCEFESRSGHHSGQGPTAGPVLLGGRHTDMSVCSRIRGAYDTLLDAFGPQDWWPSQGTFETAVGAVLTQGTAWVNAARAVASLKEAGALSPEGLSALGAAEVEALVTPAGFQRRKAATIRS